MENLDDLKYELLSYQQAYNQILKDQARKERKIKRLEKKLQKNSEAQKKISSQKRSIERFQELHLMQKEDQRKKKKTSIPIIRNILKIFEKFKESHQRNFIGKWFNKVEQLIEYEETRQSYLRNVRLTINQNIAKKFGSMFEGVTEENEDLEDDKEEAPSISNEYEEVYTKVHEDLIEQCADAHLLLVKECAARIMFRSLLILTNFAKRTGFEDLKIWTVQSIIEGNGPVNTFEGQRGTIVSYASNENNTKTIRTTLGPSSRDLTRKTISDRTLVSRFYTKSGENVSQKFGSSSLVQSFLSYMKEQKDSVFIEKQVRLRGIIKNWYIKTLVKGWNKFRYVKKDKDRDKDKAKDNRKFSQGIDARKRGRSNLNSEQKAALIQMYKGEDKKVDDLVDFNVKDIGKLLHSGAGIKPVVKETKINAVKVLPRASVGAKARPVFVLERVGCLALERDTKACFAANFNNAETSESNSIELIANKPPPPAENLLNSTNPPPPPPGANSSNSVKPPPPPPPGPNSSSSTKPPPPPPPGANSSNIVKPPPPPPPGTNPSNTTKPPPPPPPGTNPSNTTKPPPPPPPGANPSNTAKPPPPPPPGTNPSNTAKPPPPPPPGSNTSNATRPPPPPPPGANPSNSSVARPPPPPGRAPAPPGSIPNVPNPAGASLPPAPPQPKPPEDIITKKLLWEVIPKYKLKTTLWSQPISSSTKVDFSSLASLFGEKKQVQQSDSSEKPALKVQVYITSMKKANNSGIVLSRFEYKHPQLIKIINRMEDKKLKPDQITKILSISPKDDELEQLKAYKGTGEELMYSEVFLFECWVKIPFFQIRLEVMKFKLDYFNEIPELCNIIKVVSGCFQAIKTSESFKELIGFVLSIGNYLNHGTNKGNASGFSLNTLNQLSVVKGCDKAKTPLLNFILESLDKAGLNFLTEFESCKEASRFELTDIDLKIAEFNKGFSLMERAKKSTENLEEKPFVKFRKYIDNFLDNHLREFQDIVAQAGEVKKSFEQILEHFGEDKSVKLSEFFKKFLEFCETCKKTLNDISVRKGKEEMMKIAAAKKANVKPEVKEGVRNVIRNTIRMSVRGHLQAYGKHLK